MSNKEPFAVVKDGAVRVDGLVVTDKGDAVSLDAVAYALNSRVAALVREARAEEMILAYENAKRLTKHFRKLAKETFAGLR